MDELPALEAAGTGAGAWVLAGVGFEAAGAGAEGWGTAAAGWVVAAAEEPTDWNILYKSSWASAF